jgi:hypothetical protein
LQLRSLMNFALKRYALAFFPVNQGLPPPYAMRYRISVAKIAKSTKSREIRDVPC